MELKVDMPSLAGQNIDPATFQRVWDRVMPGQAAPRSDSTIPDAAVPAEPTLPPEETPPVEQPPEQPGIPELPPPEVVPPTGVEPPPVPDCQAPTPSPVPDCPQQPTCPDCPPCPERPEAPGTAPESPAFCLGESSQNDSGRLEELMALARIGAAAGQIMARRASGPCAKALSALACDHRLAFRRLSAAYFLITGRRYCPKCPAPCLPSSLPLALRQQFMWEQQWEQKNKQAAQSTADPCLKELYLELAQEGAFHAGSIRSLLEQMG